jgi:glutamate-1-semialdehyde 2,1-aminomutase
MKPLQVILDEIVRTYKAKTRTSHGFHDKLKRTFPGGILHNIRFFKPYPFIVSKAQDQHLYDLDGNGYTDYWMGHMALILGHTPKPVIDAVKRQLEHGTHFGTANANAAELGDRVCSLVPCAERVRFCCSGTESTMYASRLMRAYTGRKVILKAEGGWHGGNIPLHKGVTSPFGVPESRGLLPEEVANTKLFVFNDVDSARRSIQGNRDDLAGVIVEPVQGGAIPANAEFLKALREETETLDVLLAFDEVITGFRLGLGGGQEYYHVTPDLCTLGKVLGGGMPVGAVCGRRELMDLADPTSTKAKGDFTWIGGGTFSGNPMTMTAGNAMLKTLSSAEESVYGKIDRLAEQARTRIDAIFSEYDVPSYTGGLTSLLMTFFLTADGLPLTSKTDAAANTNPQLQRAYYLYLMTHAGIFFLPAHTGAVSYAHEDEDIERMLVATENFARLIR